MNGKKWLILLVSLAVALLVSGVGVTSSSFVDLETSNGNTLQAWASTQWVQTTQSDFEAGVLNQVDTSSSAGNVKLAVKSDWYDEAWTHRKQITIDHTKVEASLTNFPVLIGVTDTDLIDTANGGHVGQSDGGDILFTKSDGTTRLDHEIEKYTPASGELIAWVEVDSLSSTAATVIYLYYGNAICADQWNIEGTWDSNFKMVHHMKDDPDTSHIADSTSNGNNATKKGANEPNEVNGKIDKAQDFDGSDDYAKVTNSDSMNFVQGTWELWIRWDTSGSYKYLIDHGYTNRFLLYSSSSAGRMQAWVTTYAGQAKPQLPTAISTGQWYYLVVTYDGSNAKIYLDGQEKDSDPLSGDLKTETDDLYIGQYQGGGIYRWDGIIDEIRISDTARSAEWIKTCYNNQNSPSSFYSVGSEEGPYVPSGTIASQVLDTGVAGASWDALFWDETLPSNTNITFEVRASDTLFAKDAATPSWISVGGTSPVTSGLTSGRYMQWQATLTTSDTSQTPALHEVRVYHY
jgi:hypothetical protein